MEPHDPIQQWLRRADAAAGDPPVPGDDLPARVRRLAVQRQRTKTVGLGTVAAVAAVGVGVVLWIMMGSERNSNLKPITIQTSAENQNLDQLHSRLAEIRFEIAWRMRAVKAVAIEERSAACRIRLLAPDPLEEIRRETDTVALAMVRKADGLARQSAGRDSAAVQYRRAIELFPQSQWAETARQHLLEMNTTPKS